MRACGARLRSARKSLHLSQKALGLRVGVDQPAVYKWESGRTEPSLETRLLLVEVLGCDPYAIEVDPKDAEAVA
jgi:transcriptional regulator with XRE-family HTH domain